MADLALPTFIRAHHVGLTVSDREASAAWYQRVLGFRLVTKFETGIPRILMMHPESGFLVGLYNHPGGMGERFSPLRTGLDHLALAIEDDESLAAWIAHLDDLGVEHSPIRDLGHAKFVSIEDPDGIQIELWVTVTPRHPAREDG